MLNADSPDHPRLRRLVSAAFTPRRVAGLRARAEELTEGLLAVMAAKDEADLIADLAYPLPIAIICDLLGVPEAERITFHHLASVIDSAAASSSARSRRPPTGWSGSWATWWPTNGPTPATTC